MTVLVTYASKHGSTQGIAEAIGRRLGERGLDAEVRPVREVTDLERYDTVVLGSAVYPGAWLKEAQAFLDRHGEALRRVPLWLFSSGPTADDGMDSAVSVKLRERLDGLGARDHHLFRGALDRRKLGVLERTAIKPPSLRSATSAIGVTSRRGRTRSRTCGSPPRAQPS